jgi:hypothetical protein
LGPSKGHRPSDRLRAVIAVLGFLGFGGIPTPRRGNAPGGPQLCR